MSRMMVVVNQQNNVLGTLVVDQGSGQGGPESYGIQARPGERIIEVEADDAMASLSPDALHAEIARRHLNGKSRMVVVVNGQNEVLGTLVVGNGSGDGGPTSYGIQARPGERILEIEIDQSLFGLQPAELHAAIAQRHLA